MSYRDDPDADEAVRAGLKYVIPLTTVEGEVTNEYELSEGARTVTLPLRFERARADDLMQSLYIPEIRRQLESSELLLAPAGCLGPKTLGLGLWLRVRAQQKVRRARLRLGEWVAGEKFGEY